ncbi:MFS transporter [Kitasatospora sp. NBC_01266]|uniref:MFS transporter n=1 Tax=Kitasatospora sp. NBC_01266 TaxID=2903572 RepID=UPI002E34E3F3|nr:MFS transporter [Kitasatospora sp. NBC_01266]
MAPPTRLGRANALDAMTFDLAALLGPGLAGALASLAGVRAGVLLAVALICCAVPVAWRLPPGAGYAGGGALLGDLGAGLRAVVRTRPLARATAGSALSCAGQGLLVACAPLLGARALGGAGRGALLLALLAGAGLAANLLLARVPRQPAPDTVLRCAAAVQALALLLAARCRPVPVIAAVLLLGAAEGPQLTALFAVRHREAPERLRGQVFTTGASLKLTAFAFGAALAGPLASRSLPGALLAAAGFQLLAGTAVARRAPGTR